MTTTKIEFVKYGVPATCLVYFHFISIDSSEEAWLEKQLLKFSSIDIYTDMSLEWVDFLNFQNMLGSFYPSTFLCLTKVRT